RRERRTGYDFFHVSIGPSPDDKASDLRSVALLPALQCSFEIANGHCNVILSRRSRSSVASAKYCRADQSRAVMIPVRMLTKTARYLTLTTVFAPWPAIIRPSGSARIGLVNPNASI